MQIAAFVALVLFVTLLLALGNRPMLALRTADVAAVAAGPTGTVQPVEAVRVGDVARGYLESS